MMKKITALVLMITLFGAGLGNVLAKAGKVKKDAEKVNFEFKMHDSLGSTSEQWERAFEESATKGGYEVVDKDDADSVKVTIYIGKDDDDDDNDGKKDSVDKDDDGDGIEDAKQKVEEYDLDKDIPQLLETGTNEKKNEGVYFAVVGENGKMNVFRSDVDDLNFNDGESSELLNNGAIFQNAGYSPNASATRAVWIIFALRITFQVVKIGFQIYQIAKK